MIAVRRYMAEKLSDNDEFCGRISMEILNVSETKNGTGKEDLAGHNVFVTVALVAPACYASILPLSKTSLKSSVGKLGVFYRFCCLTYQRNMSQNRPLWE